MQCRTSSTAGLSHFEIGTTSPGDSLGDESKNFEPQMNADKRK
jgi:hypothetical protein